MKLQEENAASLQTELEAQEFDQVLASGVGLGNHNEVFVPAPELSASNDLSNGF